MEPRLYSWDRFVTETTPSMDPRLRIDVNVPFEKMVPRKKLDGEFRILGFCFRAEEGIRRWE